MPDWRELFDDLDDCPDLWLRRDEDLTTAYYQALLDGDRDEARELDALHRRWAGEIFLGWWTGAFRGLNE
jgi:hypothetical protein